MSCNVAQYITLINDAPNPEAEAIVHLPMQILLPRRPRRRGIVPERNMEYRVESDQGILNLHAYTQWNGIYVELQSSDMMLRKLHTHDYHHNPDGVEVPGPHMHFPSIRYPLVRSRSEWAYPFLLPYPNDLDEVVKSFCFDLGIDFEGLQFGFDTRRR